ncbi:unnamed protein product, partial [Meganyctiphanes norvegica]
KLSMLHLVTITIISLRLQGLYATNIEFEDKEDNKLSSNEDFINNGYYYPEKQKKSNSMLLQLIGKVGILQEILEDIQAKFDILTSQKCKNPKERKEGNTETLEIPLEENDVPLTVYTPHKSYPDVHRNYKSVLPMPVTNMKSIIRNPGAYTFPFTMINAIPDRPNKIIPKQPWASVPYFPSTNDIPDRPNRIIPKQQWASVPYFPMTNNIPG